MKEKEKKVETVKLILDNFKSNIFGINYYFNKFGSLAQDVDLDEGKKSKEYLETCLKEIGIDLNEPKAKQNGKKISTNKIIEFSRKLQKTPKISVKNFEILSRSSFLMLNNYFEYLLSDLLSYHYNKFQKSLNEKKFNLALKEINEYETIEEVTKSLITKEVESMMVQFTFDELLNHFQATLEIENEKDIINWNLIQECRERRHLIVHNSSLVNKKYISRTNNPYNYKIGDMLQVDKDYFINACNEFYLAGLLLSYNCWAKWDKDEITKAINGIVVDSFELLKQKEYKLVSSLTQYSQKIEARDENQEDYLLRNKFNRLIALKKLGENDTVKKELKKIKVGTASPVFKLAYAILSDTHTNILDLIKAAKSLDEIDIHKYNEWPIYDFLRDNKELNEKIQGEFKKVTLKKNPNVSKSNSKKKPLPRF